MSGSIRGLPQLQRRIHELGEAPKDILREVQLQTILRARDSVQVRSGKTRASIQSGGLTGSYAIVKAGGAARYLELGTRPHRIRPRRRSWLFFPSEAVTKERFGKRARVRWKGAPGGQFVRAVERRYGNAGYIFTKVVNHPGQAATPFLVPAAEDAVDNVGIRKIVDAWNRGA